MMHTKLTMTIILLSALSISGCSGVKNYKSTSEKNVTIKAKVDSGSMFSSSEPVLYVYKVINDCDTEIQGKVNLSKSSGVEIGISTNEKTYLEFAFFHSFLGRDSGSTRYGTVFTPKTGYKYDIEASYINDYYDLYMLENGPKSKNKELARENLKGCS